MVRSIVAPQAWCPTGPAERPDWPLSAVFFKQPNKNPRPRLQSRVFEWKSLTVTYFHWKYNQLSSAQ
ncbi:MAG: hypothetical protein Q3X95_07330, partial [Duodenibacillus sp.]|nr:hypothetical protein [Duodenibacillus sp.]